MVAWGLSFLFSIPTLIIFGKRTLSNGEVQCWALWPDDSYWTPYMTVVAFLVYFIPLTIISSRNDGQNPCSAERMLQHVDRAAQDVLYL
ncbi:Neuropeptide S receptor [Saguinus oedipus]|uniref:Neuropeptide S receptor n=1 Tax=Saguinus oedipus TaxID=9490 RepID=A0ABQ9UHU4_SAGOE|nr:Neuropeptide S receptor [Saguinus oedipus]